MRVILDSGPLGLLSNPSGSAPARHARDWARDLTDRGGVLVVPEIADYEVRRELVRAGKTAGLERLNVLGTGLMYEPLSTPAFRLAAELWAIARNEGRPTAADPALDGDVILSAQARLLGDDVVVATTNVAHLSHFVDARLWSDI